MEEKIVIHSNNRVIISENDSDTLDIKFVICDFKPNKNGVMLDRKNVDNWISTLKNKPVVGKLVKKGSDWDFTGHNVKYVKKKDEDGNEYIDIEFDTQAFGSFYNVAIETIDEEEYIVANATMWRRFKACEVIEKRFAKNKTNSDRDLPVATSWEIQTSKTHNETIDGKTIKVIDDGRFIGHCLLSDKVAPAYKSSGILNVASTDEFENELTEALYQDLLLLSSEQDINNIKTNNEGGNDMSEKIKEISSLTDNDIYTKVRRAINATDNEKWYYLSMLYPYEFRAIAYIWDREKEEDFIEFSYTVNSDDTISINSQKDVKMIFTSKEVIETQISEKDTKISELEKQLSDVNEKLTETEKEIVSSAKAVSDLVTEKTNLETQISELTPYKSKVEELEKAELDRQLEEKKAELSTFALEDNLIAEEELSSDEKLINIFSELSLENFEDSKEKIEVMKARKALANYKAQKQVLDKEVQVSEIEPQKIEQVKTDLNSEDDDKMLSAMDVVKKAFNIR